MTEEQKSKLKKLTEEQRIKLNNIGLLLFIVLRDIDVHAKTVKDIAISQLGFQKEGTYMSQTGLGEKILSILENVNILRKLVLVTDGFDELSEQNENIEDVITGRSYQNILSITTCRPHATQAIALDVDVEIRLKGFSKAQTITYVQNYAKVKFSQQNEIDSFVSQTMNQIESSVYLLEMSTNPSMLQLLCLLSQKKIKDRTSVFKYYTLYLVMQYHIKLINKGKLAKTERYSDNLYHQNLLNAGKVALMGLKQNKLVFSEDEARQTGGDAIFEIGFLTKLPSTDLDSVKVQFTHMTLQEYLAAFYIVNTSLDEGSQLLMEFCSTSQRLMGSQIILEFISNMSPKYFGEKIQNKIEEFVSKWDSDDKVDPRSRTSFLISMLEGTETLKFPLPAVIDIDFTQSSYKKSTVKRFFGMDGQGVRKISLTLDQNTRLNVLKNTTITSLDELYIVNSWWCNTWSREDNEALRGVMKKMKPGLLSIKYCSGMLLDEYTIDVIVQHVHTLIFENYGLEREDVLSIIRTEHKDLKVLEVTKSENVSVDGEVIDAASRLSSNIKLVTQGERITLIHKSATTEAVCGLPDHTELDLFCDRIRDKSACITLINKAATLKSLSLCRCCTEIDTEIAEAVSRLPDHTQLDLSGNQVTDKSACITLIQKAATMKSLSICNCGIQIDTEIAESVSRLPDDIQLDLSGNELTKIDPRLLPGVLLHMPEDKNIDMTGCEITIDVDIVKALSKMPQLKSPKASFNKLTPEAAKEFSMSQLQQLELSNCGINDIVCLPLMINLSKHCPLLELLDLNGNKLTSDEWCHHVQMKKLRKLHLVKCYMNDTTCLSLMVSLSEHCPLLERLNLRYNNLTSDEWCHHVQMKKLTWLNLSYCGLSFTVCVSLMISLSKHCPMLEELDLSSSNLTSDEWCQHIKMKQLRELNLSYCGLSSRVCVPLMISLTRHCPLLERLDLSSNKLTSDEWCHHVQMKQLKVMDLPYCEIRYCLCVINDQLI